MRFTLKDSAAAVMAVAVVVIYIGYLVFDGIPLVRDVKGMAAVALILGFASRRVGGRAAFPHPMVAWVAGLGSMALGIATLITESEILLAVFVASIAALCVAAVYFRAQEVRTTDRSQVPVAK